MDITQAQKAADKLLGYSSEVRYNADTFEYQVGINICGEFHFYGSSTNSWEDALEQAKEVKEGKQKE